MVSQRHENYIVALETIMVMMKMVMLPLFLSSSISPLVSLVLPSPTHTVLFNVPLAREYFTSQVRGFLQSLMDRDVVLSKSWT
jgi:hypothetical protein